MGTFEKDEPITEANIESPSENESDYEEGGLAALKNILNKKDRRKPKRRTSRKLQPKSKQKPPSLNKQAEDDLNIKIKWNVQPQNFIHGFAISLQASCKNYDFCWFGDPMYDVNNFKVKDDDYGSLIMIKKKMSVKMRENKRKEM